MKHLILIFCFCITNVCLGQHANTTKCALKTANSSWTWNYKKARSLDVQLDLVVEKVINTAIYYDIHPPLENPDDRSLFGAIPCDKSCAISVGLIYGKNKGTLLDLHKYPEFETVLEAMNAENISGIDFNEHRDTHYQTALKKQPGIVLYTEDKALIKLLRRQLREIERREKKEINE